MRKFFLARDCKSFPTHAKDCGQSTLGRPQRPQEHARASDLLQALCFCPWCLLRIEKHAPLFW